MDKEEEEDLIYAISLLLFVLSLTQTTPNSEYPPAGGDREWRRAAATASLPRSLWHLHPAPKSVLTLSASQVAQEAYAQAPP
jgi:hypothetical protein